MQKQVVRYSLIFLTMFLFASVVFAADTNNELVKMDFDQTSDGAVKINIYTNKPYNDKIIVNKKPDNKYVILLPETTNTMSEKPDFSAISGLNDVEVKTKQYSSLPGKGYTKITIDTKKSIDIVPQAFVAKKIVQQKQSKSKPYVSAQQVQMTVPQRVKTQKPMTDSDFSSNKQENRYNNSSLPNYVAKPQQTRTVVRRESYTQQSNYVERPRVTQTSQSSASETQQNVQQTSAQDNSTIVQENQVAENESQNKLAVDDAVATTVDEEISEDELAFFKKIIKFKQKVVRKVKQLLSIRISFSTFVTLLQFILLIVLIKVIMDLVKKTQNSSAQQSSHFPRRLIHDEEETFEPAYPSYSNMDVYSTNRSNFEEDNKEGFNVTPLSAPINFSNSQSKIQKNLYSNSNYNQPQQFSAQNDFYKPLSKISKEEKMSIFDENEKDIEKTIFKNPLTSISKDDEETLFDEAEPLEENSPFVSDKYSINEKDDFFNYSSSENEEDFFIFEDEDDEIVEYQEDYVDEDDQEYEYEEQDEQYLDDDQEYEYEYVDEDGIEYDESEDTEQVQSQSSSQQEVNPFEHLTVHSKYVIDSQKGFAQVSVDGINALIGYVGSKISVIRKFKEEINGSMQVRLNEQPDSNTMIYIIKLGNYKTLVEVKPDSIRQLLDL